MKSNNLKIFTTVLFLWITTQFSFEYENYFACFLILSFGLLHGSNDINLILSINSKSSNFYKILIKYIITILIGIVVFLASPAIMTVVFILISSFHFGEQHFSKKIVKQNNIVNLLYTVYGLVIFLLLFSTHNNQVGLIIEKITNIKINASFFNYCLFIAFISSFILIIYLLKNKLIKTNIYKEAFYLLLFLIIFKNATLIWSFSIYFIIWHSLPSLSDQITILYGVNSKENIIKYLKSSFIYWFISLVSILLITLVLLRNEPDLYLISIATIFSITCPHIFVMHKIYK